jgi:anti-sigma regulatory factor (Ser/Thr protein kinase)
MLPQAETGRPRIGYKCDSGNGIVAFQYQPEANGRAERLVFRIHGGPLAPAQARQAIATGLEQAGGSKVALELLLLTSEVVTNAVEHGRADETSVIELGVSVEPSRVKVEVADHGGGFIPVRRTNRLEEEGGWGLFLVDLLADRWGVQRGDSTQVWFELTL